MPENHNIEDFFKKRLETHEWPFQEEDWSLLEKRIDAIQPLPSATALHLTTRTIIIIIAALTAAFVLGWLTNQYFQNAHTGKSLPVSTDQNQPPSVNVIRDIPKHEALPKSAVFTTTGTNKSDNQIAASEPSIITDATSEPYITAEDDIVTDPLLHGEVIKEPLQALTTGTKYAVFQTDTLNSALPITALDISATDKGVSATLQTNIPVRSRWSIGIILAPDYNGVRLLQGRTVSTAIGGMVAYQFAPRWSASFRILYNNKKYNSEADYYKLPEGYWIKRTNGIIPDKILGSCRVVDIPFMATYHFILRKSMSFTASAGLGSYFLLDEKYHFEFNQNNPGADTQWQTKKNSRVFFGTANLALGAEFQTTPRIKVAIEPYLKIPLKEMGWGNVNLYGMGLSLTMKYRL